MPQSNHLGELDSRLVETQKFARVTSDFKDPMEYRREIDGLRALAVIAVILFHAGYQSRLSFEFVIELCSDLFWTNFELSASRSDSSRNQQNPILPVSGKFTQFVD